LHLVSLYHIRLSQRRGSCSQIRHLNAVNSFIDNTSLKYSPPSRRLLSFSISCSVVPSATVCMSEPESDLEFDLCTRTETESCPELNTPQDARAHVDVALRPNRESVSPAAREASPSDRESSSLLSVPQIDRDRAVQGTAAATAGLSQVLPPDGNMFSRGCLRCADWQNALWAERDLKLARLAAEEEVKAAQLKSTVALYKAQLDADYNMYVYKLESERKTLAARLAAEREQREMLAEAGELAAAGSAVQAKNQDLAPALSPSHNLRANCLVSLPAVAAGSSAGADVGQPAEAGDGTGSGTKGDGASPPERAASLMLADTAETAQAPATEITVTAPPETIAVARSVLDCSPRLRFATLADVAQGVLWSCADEHVRACVARPGSSWGCDQGVCRETITQSHFLTTVLPAAESVWLRLPSSHARYGVALVSSASDDAAVATGSCCSVHSGWSSADAWFADGVTGGSWVAVTAVIALPRAWPSVQTLDTGFAPDAGATVLLSLKGCAPKSQTNIQLGRGQSALPKSIYSHTKTWVTLQPPASAVVAADRLASGALLGPKEDAVRLRVRTRAGRLVSYTCVPF